MITKTRFTEILNDNLSRILPRTFIRDKIVESVIKDLEKDGLRFKVEKVYLTSKEKSDIAKNTEWVKKNSIPICVYSYPDMKLIGEYSSKREAARVHKLDRKTMNMCIEGKIQAMKNKTITVKIKEQ